MVMGVLFTTLQIQLLLVATTISCHHKIILVVRSNSANAWRASRLFLQKNRTEITSNCSAHCNPFHSQLASEKSNEVAKKRSLTKTSQLFQEESSYKLFG